jgi:hypothetical protein
MPRSRRKGSGGLKDAQLGPSLRAGLVGFSPKETAIRRRTEGAQEFALRARRAASGEEG